MSVFSEEWRICLREHYKNTVRNNDQVTLKSLVAVMHKTGFTEDELRQLEVEATMRADDVADDFVPNLDIMPSTHADTTFQPHPLECQCPQCMEINMIPHDEDGQPIAFDPDDPDSPRNQAELQQEQQAEDDEDSPAQLSMF